MRGWPYRAWLLAVFLVIQVIGCINPASTRDIVLEHAPTVVFLVGLWWFGRKAPLSNAAYTLLFIFLCLHVVGAHYLYTDVPYDRWSRAVLGRGINEIFGVSRTVHPNHFDRLVHFSFGVLICPVAAELGMRFGGVRRGFWAALFGIGFISLFGNMYEVFEWIVSLVMSPEDTENYNGQQGDNWDAQKDLALSFVGSVISGVVVWVRGAKGRVG